MHKQSPKIEEVMAFTMWLSDKQISAKWAVWNLGYIDIFGPLKEMSPQLQNLCKFAHILIMTSGTTSLLEMENNSG
jgi:hypothetical protein